MGVAKVGEGERELDQHLATSKSCSILRLCHRRDHHGYALAEGMERGVVGDKGWWGIRGVGLYKAGGTDKGLYKAGETLRVKCCRAMCARSWSWGCERRSRWKAERRSSKEEKNEKTSGSTKLEVWTNRLK